MLNRVEREPREWGVFGTAEEVTERLLTLRDAIDRDMLYIVRVYYPGLPVSGQRETIEIFADQVRPHLT